MCAPFKAQLSMLRSQSNLFDTECIFYYTLFLDLTGPYRSHFNWSYIWVIESEVSCDCVSTLLNLLLPLDHSLDMSFFKISIFYLFFKFALLLLVRYFLWFLLRWTLIFCYSLSVQKDCSATSHVRGSV